MSRTPRIVGRRSGRGWALLLSALTLTLAGCGGAGHGSASAPVTTTAAATTASTTASSTRPRARRRPGPRGAPVGTTQRVHAGTALLDVTVSKVLDPLSATGSALLPGTRAAGVQVAIRNAGGSAYDSAASGDWSLLTTSGLASPLFVRHGVCETPLADFESLIGVGETRTGCVAFSVPRRARILSVRFSPNSRTRGTVAWR